MRKPEQALVRHQHFVTPSRKIKHIIIIIIILIILIQERASEHLPGLASLLN